MEDDPSNKIGFFNFFNKWMVSEEEKVYSLILITSVTTIEYVLYSFNVSAYLHR